MHQGWFIVAIALGYIGMLFAIAAHGDRIERAQTLTSRGRPVLYSLTLAIYCTSWTFLGSVGLAAAAGWDFLTIYIGSGLMILLGAPLLKHICQIAKVHNSTSIADFLASRYGKSPLIGALVTLIVVVGTVPYIALQLKAMALSLTTILGPVGNETIPADIALMVAVSLGFFSILFGTRHIDATEHQAGLMLAIAVESVIKLVAFLCVGLFVTFWMFDGFGDIWSRARQAGLTATFTAPIDGGRWLTMCFLSFCAILLLPRQFHVGVVENHSPNEISTARWMFPLYLVLINIFVVPIALAGLLTFEQGTVNPDVFVLALPLSSGNDWVAYVAFIGALSAATAMVIVACVALGIMISNDIVMPLLIRRPALMEGLQKANSRSMTHVIVLVRRLAIGALLILAYFYYKLAGNTPALASIGLLSFAAIAQLAPAFFGGLIWRRATRAGAIAGLAAGFAMWGYTLLLPSFVRSGILDPSILSEGPFGLGLLRPEVLFNVQFGPLEHGVFWSVLANIIAYVTVSLFTEVSPIERLQADLFIPRERGTPLASRFFKTALTISELKQTIARYLGEERTERSFASYMDERGLKLTKGSEVDLDVLRFGERLLASGIGAPSARLVLSLLFKNQNLTPERAMRLLDDASAAIQYNRDLLQVALDHMDRGIAVFDRNMGLICWNRRYRNILELPSEFGRFGVSLHDILRYCAKQGAFGPGAVEDLVDDRIKRYVVSRKDFQEHYLINDTVLEVRIGNMPDGGIVVTYTDVTSRVRATEALALANETLERRVRERTEELTRLNEKLALATEAAESANASKTRFLAAAGHDIMQPLNAARLYVASLHERMEEPKMRKLTEHIDASLESAEDIISALLEISKIDAGVLTPTVTTFPIQSLLEQLIVEFAPTAEAKGLTLKAVPCSLSVRSDWQLMRRLIQNLISNAIKYTEGGKVLVGARRIGETVRIEVHDTGPGIAPSQQKIIFQEFQRLDQHAKVASGLGLGLSIVDRIAKLLDHEVSLVSTVGRGAVFGVTLPVATQAQIKAARPEAQRRNSTVAGVSVLCIDNEPDILSGLKTLLSGWGCEVRTALGKEEALEHVVNGFRPKAIIADYHLDRNKTGIEAFVCIRDALDYRPFGILSTADRNETLRSEAEENGMLVLNKPVRAASLRASLAKARMIKLPSAAE